MAKKIKVLHTEWSDGWGGQEIRVINEMIALREQGVEVCLACRDHAQIKQKAFENNIEVFTLPFRGNFDLKTMFSLRKIIKENNINIVNTHSGKDTWVGGFAAKLASAKFIRTRHLSNRIRSSRLNFINEIADFIFTTGESVKEAMIKNNRIKPKKIMSIPTGIDEEIFNPSKYEKYACRKIFDIHEDEFVIGIVAVLRDFKRHDNFLIIAQKLISRYKDKKLKFIIAGEGPKREAIEQQIVDLKLTSYVTMIGHTDEVAKFLKAIDLFVLPSDRNEGVPQSLIQALMMQVPSVSTTAGSIRDLLHQGNFLISEPTVEDILENIIQIIEEKDHITQNRDYILENFSKKAITEKIIKIYYRLLDEKNY